MEGTKRGNDQACDTQDAEQWRSLSAAYRDVDRLPPDPDVVETVWRWLVDPAVDFSGLVVDEESVLVGFAVYRWFPRPASATFGVYLDDVFGEESARGRGHAQKLIGAIVEIARDQQASVVRWIAASENVPARRLYERVATRTGWITYEADPL
ncbi:N-acetyltransferase family protein [Williamsia sp. SKLECPSW1]